MIMVHTQIHIKTIKLNSIFVRLLSTARAHSTSRMTMRTKRNIINKNKISNVDNDNIFKYNHYDQAKQTAPTNQPTLLTRFSSAKHSRALSLNPYYTPLTLALHSALDPTALTAPLSNATANHLFI
jgi:hypothetical protein